MKPRLISSFAFAARERLAGKVVVSPVATEVDKLIDVRSEMIQSSEFIIAVEGV